MGIFITISIALHIFSIFALIVLYQKRTVERVKLPTIEEDVQTIHQSIEAFITEIETENEALYEKIKYFLLEREQTWEKRLQKLEKEVSRSTAELITGEQEETEKEAQEIATEDQSIEQASNEKGENKYELVEELLEQDFSTGEIAKRLSLGKAETELIVHMIKKRTGK